MRILEPTTPGGGRAKPYLDAHSSNTRRDLASRSLLAGAVISALFFLAGCSSTRQKNEREFAALTADKPAMIYVADFELETESASGDKPGAAPMMVLSPYGAAARFVLAGGDLEKNVRQTASDITAQISRRFQETK